MPASRARAATTAVQRAGSTAHAIRGARAKSTVSTATDSSIEASRATRPARVANEAPHPSLRARWSDVTCFFIGRSSPIGSGPAASAPTRPPSERVQHHVAEHRSAVALAACDARSADDAASVAPALHADRLTRVDDAGELHAEAGDLRR